MTAPDDRAAEKDRYGPTCTETVEWAITYDDGEIETGGLMGRAGAVYAMDAVREAIAKGEAHADDYAGMRLIRRVKTVTTTAWEEVTDG